jgi:hypothetical protein
MKKDLAIGTKIHKFNRIYNLQLLPIFNVYNIYHHMTRMTTKIIQYIKN